MKSRKDIMFITYVLYRLHLFKYTPNRLYLNIITLNLRALLTYCKEKMKNVNVFSKLFPKKCIAVYSGFLPYYEVDNLIIL